MRLIHKVGFTPEEIESYRQLVFNNLIHGMRLVLEAFPVFDLSVEEQNRVGVIVLPAATLLFNTT